uniref:Uncharacterized protein n=1 Tax=Aegilops tauschii subsp. strangulata TaxID=200361 RepID=A0A453ESN9_AEGTS
MEMTPELLYGQNVYVPTAVNSYTYGYAEVGSPMDWYNHQNSLGYDAQDVYFPVSVTAKFLQYLFFLPSNIYNMLLSQAFQTDGTQCVYYATPDNGSVHPSYSPYPMDPGYIVDGSYLPQEYVPDTDPTCQLHNSLPMKQELGNGSMVSVKPLHTPQVGAHVLLELALIVLFCEACCLAFTTSIPRSKVYFVSLRHAFDQYW